MGVRKVEGGSSYGKPNASTADDALRVAGPTEGPVLLTTHFTVSDKSPFEWPSLRYGISSVSLAKAIQHVLHAMDEVYASCCFRIETYASFFNGVANQQFLGGSCLSPASSGTSLLNIPLKSRIAAFLRA